MKGLINNISEAATRFGHKAAFKIKKASPELLLIGGIACLVGGTVMACKATKKANDILDEGHETVERVKGTVGNMLETGALEIKNEEENKPIFDKEIKREIAKSKLHTLGRVAGVYAPAVALGSAGIAMIFTSHGIMRKRQGALLASYNALDAMFKTYRARVLEEEDGKERDQRYLRGDRDRDIHDLTEDEMNEVEFVDKINHAAANMADDSVWYGPYSCRFDATTSSRFSMHPFTNLNVIREVEFMATNRFHEKGYICLNEILYELGMDPVPWGQLVGRIWERGSENDNVEIEAYEEFPETPGSAIILTFKCDGVIWDRL